MGLTEEERTKRLTALREVAEKINFDPTPQREGAGVFDMWTFFSSNRSEDELLPAEPAPWSVIWANKGDPIQRFAPCGTYGCLAGWATTHPYLFQQGLAAFRVVEGPNKGQFFAGVEGTPVITRSNLARFFGLTMRESELLFFTDYEYKGEGRRYSLLARIDAVLAHEFRDMPILPIDEYYSDWSVDQVERFNIGEHL